MVSTKKFWQEKTLSEMTRDEWESVCDGCAKCCLIQLQDEDTEELAFTDVACSLLNDGTCQCTDYVNRSNRVPNCLTLNRHNVADAAKFAPSNCAYRLLVEGAPLPDWHHLVSGSRNTVHETGNSVQYRVRYEHDVDQQCIQDYIVDWP